MQRKVKGKAKDLVEICKSEGHSHERRIAEFAGGEVAVQQSGYAEEEEGEQQGVGADLAEAEFAL